MPLISPLPLAAQSSSETFSGFTGWVVSIMDALGVLGVALLVALENLFPPIPSEVILPLAGFTASQGSMNLGLAVIGATTGSVIGAAALYWLGAAFGLPRLRSWGARLPLVDVSDIDRTVDWFHRHGRSAVFFGRLLPIFRSLISIPAGIDRMNLPLFLGLTTAGSLLWNSALIGSGYALGENWHVVEGYVGQLQYLVIAAVVLAVAWFLLRRIGARRAE